MTSLLLYPCTVEAVELQARAIIIRAAISRDYQIESGQYYITTDTALTRIAMRGLFVGVALCAVIVVPLWVFSRYFGLGVL